MIGKLLPAGGMRIRGDRDCGEFNAWYAGGVLFTRIQATNTIVDGDDLRAISRLALVADIVLRKLEAGDHTGVIRILEILNGEPLSDNERERWLEWRAQTC